MSYKLFAIVPIVAALAWTFTASRAEDHPQGHSMVECAKACDDCARACETCTYHCGKMLADGMKDHLESQRLCADCATVCRAASSVVSRQGPMSLLVCTACADACKRCAESCEKFKDDAGMKACAAECRKCEKACLEMVKAHRANVAK